MLTNTRYLHILLDSNPLLIVESIDAHQLKRKFPGEHIAITKSSSYQQIVDLDLFHHVHSLDTDFIQKSSFSPLLGDATAFGTFWKGVKPLVNEKWTRIFNLSGSKINSHLAALFETTPIVGSHLRNGSVICNESPLKLATLLEQWKLSHPLIANLLHKKALNQIDFTNAEKYLKQAFELKTKFPRGDLKSILVGVKTLGKNPDDNPTLEFLGQLFTFVALDTQSLEALNQRNLAFINWSDSPTECELYLDMIVIDSPAPALEWGRNLFIAGKDPEELTENIAEIIPVNFSKWACLSFLFDYLGQPKLAHNAEQIITRYDKGSLAPFLQQDVLALKSFAKVLLEGLRRQGLTDNNLLADYWKSHQGTLSFICAIELSLQPNLIPLFRHDQDVIAIKNRLRTLNQFYERIHKACTLEIPTTDLALTL